MAWREKWRNISRYRRILLILLAGMTAGFGIGLFAVSTRQGIVYCGELLVRQEEGGVCRYTGQVNEMPAEFTVYPNDSVEYRWGNFTYGPYQIVQDPSASPKGAYLNRNLPGIAVYQGEELLFRGGYSRLPESVPIQGVNLISEDGEVLNEDPIHAREERARERCVPALRVVVETLLEPELTHYGNIGFYVVAIFVSLLIAAYICFPEIAFRFSIWGRVQDPWDAEPSDLYMLMTQLGWIVLVFAVFGVYLIALTTLN